MRECAASPGEPKRLALFSPSLEGGGAERVMVTLANGFAERSIRVTLLLAKCEGPFLSQVSPSVRVVDLNANRVRASVFGLARYLRQERPAALLSFQTHTNLIAIFARMLARVPLRLVVSERVSLTGLASHPLGPTDRALRKLIGLAYRFADVVTVVSEAMVGELKKVTGLGNDRIRFVPNPVVTPEVVELASEIPEHPFATEPGPPLIMAAGRLTPQKDYPTLLRAFALLRQNMEARLLILGEGPSRPDLEAMVEQLGLTSKVDLPGFRPNPFPYMKAASLYVLCSKFEGLPGALIQAMAVGTPVVSTDCPTGPAEILEYGRWGKLVPVGEAAALAAAMQETLRAKAHPDVARRAAYYSSDNAVSTYLDVLGLGADRKDGTPLASDRRMARAVLQ